MSRAKFSASFRSSQDVAKHLGFDLLTDIQDPCRDANVSAQILQHMLMSEVSRWGMDLCVACSNVMLSNIIRIVGLAVAASSSCRDMRKSTIFRLLTYWKLLCLCLGSNGSRIFFRRISDNRRGSWRWLSKSNKRLRSILIELGPEHAKNAKRMHQQARPAISTSQAQVSAVWPKEGQPG